MINITDLNKLIQLDKIDENVFQGASKSVGSPRIFGGQVVSQALYAMYQTVPTDRVCNSIHSYFILPGNLDKPIFYEVEKVRDGGSFSVRRVKAKQDDRIIFFMGGSFQTKEEGVDHQFDMPDVKHHSELMSWDEILKQYKEFMPKFLVEFLSIERPVIFKPTVIPNPFEREKLPNHQDIWFKIKGDNDNDPQMNQNIIAYISDYNMLSTSLHPSADKVGIKDLQMATLDHSIWFFRDFDINSWFLFSIDTPSASGARGFTRGNIFTEDGNLIASVTQEGLIRPKKSNNNKI